MNAQQALECLDYLDANEPFDFSDGDVSGSRSDISYDGDLGDDSGDDENGAGDGEGSNVVDGDGDDDVDPLVVRREVCGRGRGRGHRGGRCGGRRRGSGGGGRGRGRGEEFDLVSVGERERREERDDTRGLAIIWGQAAFHFFCARKQATFPPSCDSAPLCTGAYMHAQRRLSWRHH